MYTTKHINFAKIPNGYLLVEIVTSWDSNNKLNRKVSCICNSSLDWDSGAVIRGGSEYTTALSGTIDGKFFNFTFENKNGIPTEKIISSDVALPISAQTVTLTASAIPIKTDGKITGFSVNKESEETFEAVGAVDLTKPYAEASITLNSDCTEGTVTIRGSYRGTKTGNLRLSYEIYDIASGGRRFHGSGVVSDLTHPFTMTRPLNNLGKHLRGNEIYCEYRVGFLDDSKSEFVAKLTTTMPTNVQSIDVTDFRMIQGQTLSYSELKRYIKLQGAKGKTPQNTNFTIRSLSGSVVVSTSGITAVSERQNAELIVTAEDADSSVLPVSVFVTVISNSGHPVFEKDIRRLDTKLFDDFNYAILYHEGSQATFDRESTRIIDVKTACDDMADAINDTLTNLGSERRVEKMPKINEKNCWYRIVNDWASALEAYSPNPPTPQRPRFTGYLRDLPVGKTVAIQLDNRYMYSTQTFLCVEQRSSSTVLLEYGDPISSQGKTLRPWFAAKWTDRTLEYGDEVELWGQQSLHGYDAPIFYGERFADDTSSYNQVLYSTYAHKEYYPVPESGSYSYFGIELAYLDSLINDTVVYYGRDGELFTTEAKAFIPSKKELGGGGDDGFADWSDALGTFEIYGRGSVSGDILTRTPYGYTDDDKYYFYSAYKTDRMSEPNFNRKLAYKKIRGRTDEPILLWQPHTHFNVGDYIFYEWVATGRRANYKCTTEHTSGDVFDAFYWDECEFLDSYKFGIQRAFFFNPALYATDGVIRF